jgi:hypothetical protein
VVRVYASFEEQSLSQEDSFNCPLYLPSVNSLPSYILSNAFQLPFNRNQPVYGSSFSQQQPHAAGISQDNPSSSFTERIRNHEEDRHEKQPIITLPITTLEEKEECYLNRISLVSCSLWMIPHS